jgi:hypothetical protein
MSGYYMYHKTTYVEFERHKYAILWWVFMYPAQYPGAYFETFFIQNSIHVYSSSLVQPDIPTQCHVIHGCTKFLDQHHSYMLTWSAFPNISPPIEHRPNARDTGLIETENCSSWKVKLTFENLDKNRLYSS